MWNGIANDINSWNSVEITACTKQKTNYKSYAIASRNWWNRNKAKVYGNHFFYPIIFMYIKQVCFIKIDCHSANRVTHSQMFLPTVSGHDKKFYKFYKKINRQYII